MTGAGLVARGRGRHQRPTAWSRWLVAAVPVLLGLVVWLPALATLLTGMHMAYGNTAAAAAFGVVAVASFAAVAVTLTLTLPRR